VDPSWLRIGAGDGLFVSTVMNLQVRGIYMLRANTWQVPYHRAQH
jgi:hypothetical protein